MFSHVNQISSTIGLAVSTLISAIPLVVMFLFASGNLDNPALGMKAQTGTLENIQDNVVELVVAHVNEMCENSHSC